ncbi:MAG: PepSY domain-containing protein [Thermoanaerobaculia bacterium]|nr:PepSY domain-containing protein [Thermoanaerobaculia bacterium]
MNVRSVLVFWHRWFGLLASLWLILLAMTGSIIVFYDELDVLLSDQRVASPSGEKVPLQVALDAAEASRPGTYARFVDLANVPTETMRVFLADRADSASPLQHETHVFVDPYTGRIAGVREMDSWHIDRHHLMDFVYGLHLDLHLGGVAVWLLGLLGILWTLDHFVGAALAFPKLKRWSRSFKVRWDAGGSRRVYDLHRAGGLWFFPITLVLAFTGAYFNWYDYFEGVASRVSAITPRYSWTASVLDSPLYDMPISLDGAVSAARTAADGAEVDMIAILPAKGIYEARVFDHRDMDMYGRRMIAVDGRSGAILEDLHAADGTSADVFFAWQYPLHSGKGFGWPGRLAIFFAGLAVLGLNLTGIMIWWRKRRGRSSR